MAVRQTGWSRQREYNVRCKGPEVVDPGVLWKYFLEAGNGVGMRRERRHPETCLAQWWSAAQGAAAGKMAQLL